MLRYAAAAALMGLAALTAPALAAADTVTQWNQNAATSLYVTAAQPPNVSVLHMAMVQGAVYDAVNAIDGGREGYLLTSRVATPTDSKDAAAATAAYKVLVSIVPVQEPVLTALYNASLAGISDGTAKTRGIAVGNAAAAAMIAARTADGRFGLSGFLTGTTPGVWRPVLPAFGNDPNAWVKDVKPFLIKKASQFRSSGPYELTSRKYARSSRRSRRSARPRPRSPTVARSDERGALLGREPAADLEPDPQLALRLGGRVARRERAPVRRGLPDRRRRVHRRLGREGALLVLAPDHGDPRGRHRRQPPDGEGRELAAARGQPGVPGASLRPPRPERRGREDPAGVLPHRPARVDGHERRGATRSYTRVSDAIEELVDVRVWSGIHFRNADEASVQISRQIANYRDRHYFDRIHHDHDD